MALARRFSASSMAWPLRGPGAHHPVAVHRAQEGPAAVLGVGRRWALGAWALGAWALAYMAGTLGLPGEAHQLGAAPTPVHQAHDSCPVPHGAGGTGLGAAPVGVGLYEALPRLVGLGAPQDDVQAVWARGPQVGHGQPGEL